MTDNGFPKHHMTAQRKHCRVIVTKNKVSLDDKREKYTQIKV